MEGHWPTESILITLPCSIIWAILPRHIRSRCFD
jgi:hypothetical protein